MEKGPPVCVPKFSKNSSEEHDHLMSKPMKLPILQAGVHTWHWLAKEIWDIIGNVTGPSP